MDFPGRVVFPPAVEWFVNPSVPLRAPFTTGQPRACLNETTIELITEDVRPEVLNDGQNRCRRAGEQQVAVPGSFRGRIPEDGGGQRGKRGKAKRRKRGEKEEQEEEEKVKRKKKGRTGRKERKEEERKTKEQEKEK